MKRKSFVKEPNTKSSDQVNNLQSYLDYMGLLVEKIHGVWELIMEKPDSVDNYKMGQKFNVDQIFEIWETISRETCIHDGFQIKLCEQMEEIQKTQHQRSK